MCELDSICELHSTDLTHDPDVAQKYGFVQVLVIFVSQPFFIDVNLSGINTLLLCCNESPCTV